MNNELARELRLICGHDSRSVDGCVTREAADALEAMQAAPATYTAWLASLKTEDRYDFDREGRGYKKDCGHMMLLAFNAGITSVSGAADPVGRPAGEQTAAVSAAPPLTDEQVFAACSDVLGYGMLDADTRQTALDVARAIERAVRAQP